MRSLLNFLIRHMNLILFLILEGIALVMLSSTHNYHSSVAADVFGGLTTRLSASVENVKSFTRLRQVNRQLAFENAMLRQKLEGTKRITPATETIVNDTVNKLYYSYITAKVANNSVNKQKNFFTLDRGLSSGVVNGMAVVSPDGIAGVIVASSQNFSVAMSVLNLNFRQSVRIKKNNYFGSMSWPGKNYMYVEVTEIPLHAEVAVGDTIVTTGFSALFPENIMIGTVEEEPVMGGDFLTLKVKLSTDMKRLTYVYIIKSRYKGERMGLEAEVENE
jgi:rod shape-determining protein MreC